MSNQIQREFKAMFDRVRDPEMRAKAKKKEEKEKRLKDKKEDYGL